ncbi:MAG: ATP-binding protein [Bacteroidota bacterium]
METQNKEYKSLQKIQTGDKGFKELAKTCVCLANAQGGVILIGIDDKLHEPPKEQRIEQKIINITLEKLRGFTFSVALSSSLILTHQNGGEYFEIIVYPSQKVVATTSDGKIYIRIADKCEPVRGEDLQRIVAEKDAFQWELVSRNISLDSIPSGNIEKLIHDIRQSDRVKDSVKEKSEIEILEHYNLINNHQLTNLGVLWIGTAQQRSRLSYPITVQYIVYDFLEQKTRKYNWDDYTLNPMELLYAIEKEAVELNYSYEFPDGLFRNQVRHYPKEVIRELLINAFAHKSYLISADISIEVYPNSLRISSPGSLPLGITSENILHEKHRRNPHLIKLLHDLKLMEGEGSGYDLIYEKLSADAKPFPVIESDFNKVAVFLESKIVDIEALRLTDYITQHFQLTQREKIVVGVVARHQKILSTELTKILQLPEENRLRSWYIKLVEKNILLTHGKGKGNAFIINPKLLSDSKLNIKPTLKTLEPYVLEQLILTDFQNYPNSSIGNIQKRIADIPKKELQKIIYGLVEQGRVIGKGSKTYRSYSLAEKKRNEKEK